MSQCADSGRARVAGSSRTSGMAAATSSTRQPAVEGDASGGPRDIEAEDATGRPSGSGEDAIEVAGSSPKRSREPLRAAAAAPARSPAAWPALPMARVARKLAPATSAAPMAPAVQAPCMAMSQRPLEACGMLSAMSVTATGVPPSAKPTKARATARPKKEGAAADARPATTMMTMLSMSACRRPRRSARAPSSGTPTSIEANTIDDSDASAPAPNDHEHRTAGARYDKIITSPASAYQHAAAYAVTSSCVKPKPIAATCASTSSRPGPEPASTGIAENRRGNQEHEEDRQRRGPRVINHKTRKQRLRREEERQRKGGKKVTCRTATTRR